MHRRTAQAVLLAASSGIVISAAFAAPAGPATRATTTVVTHGFSPDSKGAWVETMARAILARAGGGTIFRYTGDGGAWTHVPAPEADGSSGDIVLIFNWVPESDGPAAGPNWNYAQAAGDELYAQLRAPRFIDAPPGFLPPEDLASGRAVHLIGHSRGACVNSEAARRLAIDGLPVEQLTTLDPHPVNGTLDPPYNFDWGDPLPMIWSNVLWADNYWRADGGGLINGLDFDGIPIAGAFNTQLSEAALNCCAYAFAHSDVHLWYHGTIDLAPNPCDGDQCITSQMRQTWWPEGYAQRGYFYSQIGGGAAQRPGPLPSGTQPGSVPVLFGGAFDGASYAGWLHHGGSVAGQVVSTSGNGYLRLGPGAASTAVHNRFLLPADAAAIVLDYRVQTAEAGEALDLALIDADGAIHPVGSIAVRTAGGWITGYELEIPPGLPRGGAAGLYRLSLSLAGAAPIDAVVNIDNLDVLRSLPCPADVNGDSVVNFDDILAAIASWGACPGCPSDANGDGTVDFDDVLIIINGWGECM